MEWVKFNVAILLSIFARLALTAPGFFGEFEVTGLEIYSPFQADPKSITNTTVSCEYAASPGWSRCRLLL